MSRKTIVNHDPYLSIKAAADYTGFSTNTLRRRVADGKIPASKFGTRTTRIRQSALDAWLESGDPA